MNEYSDDLTSHENISQHRGILEAVFSWLPCCLLFASSAHCELLASPNPLQASRQGARRTGAAARPGPGGGRTPHGRSARPQG